MSNATRMFALAAALAAFALRGAWAAETLQEVTVTAHRIELEKRVAKFVDHIAAMENGREALARWQSPAVCPLVSGLPRQDGEFILERFSQIAQQAGVPLGAEHCTANLYILVTDQPEALLRGMEKRNRLFTFGYVTSSYPPVETPASVVDEFIKTPRAVRVWYSSYEKDAWGNPMSYCRATDLIPDGDPNQYFQCNRGIAGGSHLVFNTIWWITRAFVIVDQKRLHQVKLGQLADYVALSGLAKLKPDASLGDAPTILTLFDGDPEKAPSGMTEWDQAFLKSLYSTEQKSMIQRSEIARKMVHDIAP